MKSLFYVIRNNHPVEEFAQEYCVDIKRKLVFVEIKEEEKVKEYTLYIAKGCIYKDPVSGKYFNYYFDYDGNELFTYISEEPLYS